MITAALAREAGGGHRGRSGPGPGPRPRTLIIVNAESLRRGTTEGDELCEIEGIGPVSVAAAKELLSEGGFQYLVKEGFDIKTVTRSTRVVANCIDMALVVRDRVCARPGCGNRLGLERDHRQLDYGNDGPTELDNLVRLCPSCHRLKTDGGWRLEGRPGAWKWVAPAKPPSAPADGPGPQGGGGQRKGQGVREEGPERAQADLMLRVGPGPPAPEPAPARRPPRPEAGPLCSAAWRARGQSRCALRRLALVSCLVTSHFPRLEDLHRPSDASLQRIFRFVAPRGRLSACSFRFIERAADSLKGPSDRSGLTRWPRNEPCRGLERAR